MKKDLMDSEFLEDTEWIANGMNDIPLKMAIGQGYVPATCYLPGIIVMNLMNEGKDPCNGCNLDRSICKGRF